MRSWRGLPDQRVVGDRLSTSTRETPQEMARWFPGFACAVVLFMAGCSRPVEPTAFVAIEHQISPDPARVGPPIVTLKLADATGRPVTGAHIAIETDMSHAGMSPGFAVAKEVEAGSYKAPVEFQMAGDWVILLHVTLPDGKKLERQIDVRGVRPGVVPNVLPN
jgi:hypothetical protein